MNTSNRFSEELDYLAPYVDAVVGQAPASSDTSRAQDRLLQRLEAARGASAIPVPSLQWRWAAAAAVVAVVTTALVPFMPGNSDGVAFAEVQRHFENFETMHAAMTTETGGRVAMEMELVMDDQGRTRLDAGDLYSYIINPHEGRMLQLFHQSRTAMELSLGAGGAVPDEARLGWLKEIRAFQGQAVRLPGRKIVDGRPVTGFRLEAGGMDMVLWATREGEPVRLELRGGRGDGPMSVTRVDFRFDMPVAPGSFDLESPSGYTLLDRGRDAG